MQKYVIALYIRLSIESLNYILKIPFHVVDKEQLNYSH